MLSDWDRETLAEMERHILAEDPRLSRSFEATSANRGVLFTAVIVMSLVVLAISILLGLPIVGWTAICLVVGAYAGGHWRHRHPRA